MRHLAPVGSKINDPRFTLCLCFQYSRHYNRASNLSHLSILLSRVTLVSTRHYHLGSHRMAYNYHTASAPALYAHVYARQCSESTKFSPPSIICLPHTYYTKSKILRNLVPDVSAKILFFCVLSPLGVPSSLTHEVCRSLFL